MRLSVECGIEAMANIMVDVMETISPIRVIICSDAKTNPCKIMKVMIRPTNRLIFIMKLRGGKSYPSYNALYYNHTLEA